MTYKLDTRYDGRASFYGKATVETTEYDTYTEMDLYSYTTLVARIQTMHSDNVPVAAVMGLYSATTTRHIKEFLRQNGFKAETSKQIMEDYGV